DERAGLPDRQKKRSPFRKLAQVDVSAMRSWRHRAGDAWAERRKVTIGWRDAQRALERLERPVDVRRKLRVHLFQVNIPGFALPLRIIPRQQACPQRARIVENRAPIERLESLVANLQHIARLGIFYGDGSDDRVRAAAGIALPEVPQHIYRYARLHFVQEV